MKKVILLSLVAAIMALGFAGCNVCAHSKLDSEIIDPVTCQKDGKLQFFCASCGKKASVQVLKHEEFAEHQYVGKTELTEGMYGYSIIECGVCKLCGEDEANTYHTFVQGDGKHCYSCGQTKDEIRAHAE